jgi:hypothetical protein
VSVSGSTGSTVRQVGWFNFETSTVRLRDSISFPKDSHFGVLKIEFSDRPRSLDRRWFGDRRQTRD